MIDWILKLLMPSTMPLKGSKTPIETILNTRQGVGSLKRNNGLNRDEQPL